MYSRMFWKGVASIFGPVEFEFPEPDRAPEYSEDALGRDRYRLRMDRRRVLATRRRLTAKRAG